MSDTPPFVSLQPSPDDPGFAEIFQADANRMYRHTLGFLVGRFVSDVRQADEAECSGHFMVDDCRISMAHETQFDAIEMRCALPALPPTEALLRRLLEHDLTLGQGDIVLGFDAASHCIEAVAHVNMGLVSGNEEQMGTDLLGRLVETLEDVCGTPLQAMRTLQPFLADDDGANTSTNTGRDNEDIDDNALPMLASLAKQLEQHERTSYRELVGQLASLLPLAHEAAGGTQDDACFVVDDVTIALHHDWDSHTVGFYADLGLLPQDGAATIMRRLLESNTDRGHPHGPARFGLHPVSGRLVAHFAFAPAMLGTDGTLCRDVMAELAAIVKRVRDWT